MRFVVNDIAASQGGALTILRQFYNYVKKNCHEDQWFFLLGGNYLEETEHIRIVTLPQVKSSHLRKVWFDCIRGRDLIASLKPDAVLSLQNIITFGCQVPQAVYIHQSIPFQTVKDFSLFKKQERSTAFIQKVIGQFINASARHADAVIVQTAWMRDAVATKAGIGRDSIFIAMPDVENPPFLDDIPCFSSRRFFYPTADSLYKNNDIILQASNLLSKIGLHDFTVELTLPHGTIQHPNIQCIGYLKREELFRHYHSSILLFASTIETIGLPLLEAASVGTSIIAADTPFANDILSNYTNVVYYNPLDAEELALRMKDAMIRPVSKGVPYALATTSEWSVVIDVLHRLGKHIAQ